MSEIEKYEFSFKAANEINEDGYVKLQTTLSSKVVHLDKNVIQCQPFD